ncbi:MAG: class I SAM-dependent methyltransferase [Solirubrobacteraceae bacterium]
MVNIGCGTGNAALLVAERGARVTGVDPAPRLLEVARTQARERRLDIAFSAGEAAALPLADAGADALLSVFAVIFAPDAHAAAAEMTRVTRAGRAHRGVRMAPHRRPARSDADSPRGGRCRGPSHHRRPGGRSIGMTGSHSRGSSVHTDSRFRSRSTASSSRPRRRRASCRHHGGTPTFSHSAIRRANPSAQQPIAAPITPRRPMTRRSTGAGHRVDQYPR